MEIEIKRPGSETWEPVRDLGAVKFADLPGSLVRYPFGGSYLVTRVNGVTEPDASGRRSLQTEVVTGE